MEAPFQIHHGNAMDLPLLPSPPVSSISVFQFHLQQHPWVRCNSQLPASVSTIVTLLACLLNASQEEDVDGWMGGYMHMYNRETNQLPFFLKDMYKNLKKNDSGGQEPEATGVTPAVYGGDHKLSGAPCLFFLECEALKPSKQ
ncbi:uncharacterized protein [Aegilops tauschii subsp. strangulata]|uniref:uncharacterized protein isoform X2 n=1 Tax=Aegilops tauschii subsp. strangulata TaxID=200361 RepID=UPI001ABC6147|nr:uncharacterized protein LOC109745135 isoform X7 [Aegilops tauschii subsp. strangulata]